MTWYRVGPAGIPGSLKTDMDAVLNKKFGTSTTYPPNTWPDNVNLLGPLPEKTVSGSIAHIEDGADGVPLKNWLVTLPASLSGYSEVNAVRSGKNLYDIDGAVYNGDFYDASGNVVRYADCAVSWIKVNPSTKYSFSCTKETSQTVNVRIAWCKSDKSFISRQGLFSDNQFPMTLTTPSNCEWVQLSVNQYGTALIAQNNWSIQVEQNDTASTFEEYNGTQYTVSLGRTIYGGTADIVTGEGEGTYPTIKISDLTFVKDANCQHTFRCTNLPRKYGSGVYNIFCLSSAFTTYTSGNSTGSNIASLEVGNDNTIFLNGGSATFYITTDSSFDDKTAMDFANAYGSTELIYEASTPTPFTFTPITPTPNTALGVNNFWADEGDSDVTYRADISLALQALGGGGRGLMGMMMQRPAEEQLTEEDPEEVPEEETETDER